MKPLKEYLHVTRTQLKGYFVHLTVILLKKPFMNI